MLLVLTYCGWIFSLPVFPTQDGPIHLYYAHILRELYSGSGSFGEYFSVRYPPPPYVAHYLLLLVLMQFFGAVMAEKLVVCLIVILTSCGFLQLIRVVSKRGLVLGLLGIPLSLNWTVGMGFHNFGLSFAMSLFAIACWIRGRTNDSNRARIGFVILAVLMLFTHPVPLLITILYAWSDLILVCLLPVSSIWNRYRRDLYAALGASLTLTYIVLFVDRSRASEDVTHQLIQWGMLRDLLHGRPLSLVFETPGAIVYQTFLFFIAGLGLLCALFRLRNNWKKKIVDSGTTMTLVAVVLTILYPVTPRGMNGSDYFGDRMVLYILFFLIAGVAQNYNSAPRQWHYAAASVCSLVAVFVLAIDDSDVRDVAKAMSRLEHSTLGAPGVAGIFIDPPRVPTSGHLTYDPYIWSAARYFRRTNAVMMNAPWLGLPILPIASKDRLLAMQFPDKLMNYPDRFASELIRDQKARDFVGGHIDFIIFMGYSGTRPDARDRLVQENWPHPWMCKREDWFAVCGNP